MNQKFYHSILIIFCLSCFAINGNSQVLLQLEKFNDPIAHKFAPGSSITYQTIAGGNRWFTDKIEKINYGDDVLVFVRGYETLDNITKVKIINQRTRYLGDKLIQFSIAWFIYGGIAHLINEDYKFGWDTAAIGGTGLFTGFLLKKVASSKTYNVKKRDRLRIIDISWPAPRG